MRQTSASTTSPAADHQWQQGHAPRRDDSSVHVQHGKVDLCAAVRDACAELAAALAYTAISRARTAGALTVPADMAALILIIVREAVANAIKYAHPTGVEGKLSGVRARIERRDRHRRDRRRRRPAGEFRSGHGRRHRLAPHARVERTAGRQADLQVDVSWPGRALARGDAGAGSRGKWPDGRCQWRSAPGGRLAGRAWRAAARGVACRRLHHRRQGTHHLL